MPDFPRITPPSRGKYGSTRCELDGISFDSKKERDYYADLRLREMAHEVAGIQIHPRYPITINGVHVCDVVLDFEFTERRTGQKRYIDVKGFATDVSRLKKKLIESCYGITVEWV